MLSNKQLVIVTNIWKYLSSFEHRTRLIVTNFWQLFSKIFGETSLIVRNIWRFPYRDILEERMRRMFYPEKAVVPETLQTEEFLVRPLRATDVELDYDAVITSRAELFLRSEGSWPREGFTLEENLADLVEHEQEHLARETWPGDSEHMCAVSVAINLLVGYVSCLGITLLPHTRSLTLHENACPGKRSSTG